MSLVIVHTQEKKEIELLLPRLMGLFQNKSKDSKSSLLKVHMYLFVDCCEKDHNIGGVEIYIFWVPGITVSTASALLRLLAIVVATHR